MESASKILAIAISCTLGSVSQIEAQEEKPHQPDRQQQDVSPEQQEENKDIPTITNPAVLMRKIWISFWKSNGNMWKHYPDYRIVGEGQEQDYFDSRHYSEFNLKTKMMNGSWSSDSILRKRIRPTWKHQKEIEREAAKLIKQGVIKIEW